MSMFDYSAVQRNAAMLMPELQAETLRQQLGVEQLQSAKLGNVAAEQEMQARQIAAQDARQRVGQRDLALQQFQTRPTHQGALSLITSFPELREPITEAWKLREDAQNQSDLRFLGTTRALLMGGRVDDAIAQAEQRITIDRKAGDDVSDDEAMVKLMRENPSLAAVQMTGLIGAIVGPEKLADTVAKLNEDDRAGALFPAQRRRAVAEASKAETEATYAPQIIRSNLLNDEANRRNVDSQITTRAAQVEIARDTLTTNVELKLQEMEAAGARPDPGSVQIMNTAVVSGASNTALAQQTRVLADEFSASPARGGAFSDLTEFSKRTFGVQDGVSTLRGRYQQLVNNAAIKSLPPGPASDKDIKLAREGFPPPTAPRDYIVSWLKGMAKMQDIAAANDNARAEWIAGNGNLGTAKRDLTVNGVQIPRGTTFGAYQQQSAATAGRQQLPPRSYMEFGR
ncbi:hypothetical protein ASE90_05165 [Sphingomonas sp. Leaf67]|uniref:hypothetical protein n=1 Tax=Sphingomonas sp. Leaf67 TaxID=1736230 RepID=UPI0006F37EDF|nr:hypothetical protein [Sphingomonas sp. Leaf67]KQN92119.1 hypothetical protein ASE90_05165 [Sphingomonas sp. Leaf67]